MSLSFNISGNARSLCCISLNGRGDDDGPHFAHLGGWIGQRGAAMIAHATVTVAGSVARFLEGWQGFEVAVVAVLTTVVIVFFVRHRRRSGSRGSVFVLHRRRRRRCVRGARGDRPGNRRI